MGGRHYEYSNIEYLQMIRLYALADYKTSEARRLYAAPENIQKLSKQGIIDPQIPSTQTILGANQRLLDYGQFRTPGHARGHGRSRKSLNLEEKIMEYCEQHPEKSTRQAARHFGVSHYYVWNIYDKVSNQPFLRDKWLQIIDRGYWTPKKNSTVCSKHFESKCFIQREHRRMMMKDSIPTLDVPLVFNDRGKSKRTGTTDEEPSTSAAAELEYQPSRYAIVSGDQDEQEDTLEEIIIKEEISDEDRNQCRLCLSVGRRMQELGDYAPLYRKLLFEYNYQNTTIPSFMYQMLACWECIAELRRVQRFQEKVRRANAAFETNQNQKSENMSNLSTIIIGEYNNSTSGNVGRVSGLEVCAQDIKEEAIETEVEETSVPDPLEVGQGAEKTEKIVMQIEKEPNVTQKAAKRAKTDSKTSKNVAKRAKTDQNEPKTTQEEENNPKSTTETTDSAIFAKVKIEIDELENILAERRNKESFKAMKFKCDSCILGFTDHNRLLEHNKNFHDEDVGSCECDICERRFDDERQMQAHYRNHFVKFVCKLCQFECYTKTGRSIHCKRHDSLTTQKQRAGTSGSSFDT